jgi:putative transcriptional regulator
MPVSNKVRYHRFLREEMSQAELAEKIGVSRQTIVAIERGNYNPSIELALRVARCWGRRSRSSSSSGRNAMTRRDLILLRVLWVLATLALAALWRAEALVLLIPLAVLRTVPRESPPPAIRTSASGSRITARATSRSRSPTAALSAHRALWLQLGHEPPNGCGCSSRRSW